MARTWDPKRGVWINRVTGPMGGSNKKPPPGYKFVPGAGKTYGYNVFEKITKPEKKKKPKPAPSSSGGRSRSRSSSSGSKDKKLKKYIKKATDIKPEKREVNPEDTVAWHLAQLLDQDSPYMQRARYWATKGAQSRGLQNSTMAAEAGEAAAIDRALPIASQDANTFFSQGINNQNVTNRFLENNQNLFASLALGEQSFLNNRVLLGDELAARFELSRLNALTSAFSARGWTPEQQANAANIINSIYSNSPWSVNNFSTI